VLAERSEAGGAVKGLIGYIRDHVTEFNTTTDKEWEEFLEAVFANAPSPGSWFWAGPHTAKVLGCKEGWNQIPEVKP
jgi:hypothetical protein